MDARSLLRAKKAEAKINHPYAVYSASGQLRCSICAVPVKQWDAHLLTKQHRTSVARERAEQEKARAKRPAEDVGSAANGSKKARVTESTNAGASGSSSGPSGLPAGFFSSGNGPAAVDDDEEEEEEEEETAHAGPSTSTSTASAIPSAPVAAAPPAKTGDAELDDFLSSLNDDTESPSTPAPVTVAAPTTTAASRRKIPAYKEIAPGQASYEAAPVRIAPADEGANSKEEEVEPEETEAERRARLEREEREEIVSRLEEEERAQEDADSRVSSLKQRMEMIKKRREARGAGGAANAKPKGKPVKSANANGA